MVFRLRLLGGLREHIWFGFLKENELLVRSFLSLPEPAHRAPEQSKERSRRLNPLKQKQMEDRCAFLEEEVPRIESAIAHTEEELGVYVSAAETQRLSALAEELREQLATFTAEWEELMVQLEA